MGSEIQPVFECERLKRTSGFTYRLMPEPQVIGHLLRLGCQDKKAGSERFSFVEQAEIRRDLIGYR